MKKLPLFFFFFFCLSAFICGCKSFQETEKNVRQDLDRALRQTIAQKGMHNMRQDSIRAYRTLSKQADEKMTFMVGDRTLRSHLRIAELKEKAFITCTVTPTDNRLEVDFRSDAHCSAALIFSLSDQRPALMWSILALCSFCFSLNWQRFRPAAPVTVTGTSLSKRLSPENIEHYSTLHLTPMQQQLMEMFFAAPSHRLTKQEICQALWPKKENADETLYTLMRRLKRAIGPCSTLQIESDRGRAYELKSTDNEATEECQ